jgi:hypothetical protein
MEENQFVEVDDAQLDHLVPAEERVEPDVTQDEGDRSILGKFHVIRILWLAIRSR